MTFYRGKVSSQNDLCISNVPDNIYSFQILNKMVMSDHTPCSLFIKVTDTISLNTIKNISALNFDYSHYDHSNYIRKGIKTSNVNAADIINEFTKRDHTLPRTKTITWIGIIEICGL